MSEPKSYDRIAATPFEDQVSRPCSCDGCKHDGQHAEGCAVHEEPAAECDCSKNSARNVTSSIRGRWSEAGELAEEIEPEP